MRRVKRAVLRVVLAGSAVATAGTAGAATWDEALQGDLSNERLAPTLFVLEGGLPAQNGETGHNVVTGRVGRAPDGTIERDYLHLVVPDGFLLSELRIGQQTQFGGNGSFLGIASGATMPVEPDASSAAGLLGWRIVGPADRGTSVLDEMGESGNGASGFAGALPAGDYTVWAQELVPGSFLYRYNFVLSAVPDLPGSVTLAMGGIALALTAARRRKSSALRPGKTTSRRHFRGAALTTK